LVIVADSISFQLSITQLPISARQLALLQYGSDQVVDGRLLGDARHPLLLVRHPDGYLGALSNKKVGSLNEHIYPSPLCAQGWGFSVNIGKISNLKREMKIKIRI